MKIVSWNVNGIRSIYNKGFLEWFTKESPDILCLQETKANLNQFPTPLVEFKNFKLIHSSAVRAGYSGVATWSKEKILDTEKLDDQLTDDEGRTLIHELKDFFLLNCYFPNGARDHSRVDFKMRYNELILKKIQKLEKKKPVIIVGDFNTAHHPIDLANPTSNKKTTGFLPREREFLDTFFSKKMVDGFRSLNPDKKGAYTWWSNRPGCRDRNIGWRIDYICYSQSLQNRFKDVTHLDKVRGSDHCPVMGIIE
jgi:exodeoxyribonuclease III